MTMFTTRTRCIGCAATKLETLSRGRYRDDPLRSFLLEDPGGDRAYPHLENEEWALVECARCHLRFHRLILSPRWNEVRFDQWSSEEDIREFERRHFGDDLFRRAFDRARRHVQHLLRLEHLTRSICGTRAPRLLDFGCGFGDFIEMASQFGFEATGVDRDEARRSGARIQIRRELSELDGWFDVVTMFEVLEHLDDPDGTLVALAKRLRRDGILVVEVPDCSGVTDITDRDSYLKLHPIDHINAFTPDTLQGFVERHGFQRIRKRPAFATLSPVRLAKDVAAAALKTRTTQMYFRKLTD